MKLKVIMMIIVDWPKVHSGFSDGTEDSNFLANPIIM